ncbi:MAG: DUF1573 domain-containing protein [Crocinitomicaceae bacterium]|nr:DUF1573 domain-containing protein [Crocinitomicaceae bacterium]
MLVKLIATGLVLAAVGTTSVTTKDELKKLNRLELNESSIEWETTEIDLGEIEQGKPVDITFNFNNTGNEPVIISDVKAGCGCTIVNFDKKPIPSGDSSEITATFNAKAEGPFNKSIRVYTNVNDTPIILRFNGIVS